MARRRKGKRPGAGASPEGDGIAGADAGKAPPASPPAQPGHAEEATPAWLAIPVDESAIEFYREPDAAGGEGRPGAGRAAEAAPLLPAGGEEGAGVGGSAGFPLVETYGRSDGASEAPFADELDLLCFEVADESFGIDIRRVKEIIRARPATELPGMEAYVSGIISLRGAIVPVFDLRRRLGFEKSEDARPDARIIVLSFGEKSAGLFVDAVSQKIRLPQDSMLPPPAVLGNQEAAFLLGICRHQGRLISVLDPEGVLGLEGDSSDEGKHEDGAGKAA